MAGGPGLVFVNLADGRTLAVLGHQGNLSSLWLLNVLSSGLPSTR